jgi:hypothetical protein
LHADQLKPYDDFSRCSWEPRHVDRPISRRWRASLRLIAGLAFILFGIDRVDPAARGAHAFRPLLLPGFMLIWPLAIVRWRKLATRAADHA